MSDDIRAVQLYAILVFVIGIYIASLVLIYFLIGNPATLYCHDARGHTYTTCTVDKPKARQ